MALTPKQKNWCEEWNISPRLVDAISEALTAAVEDSCPTCGETSCRCTLDEFPFGLESVTPPVAPNLAERWGGEDAPAASTPTTTASGLGANSDKERKMRDNAEKAVIADLKQRVNRKKDTVKMHPSTDAPN